MGIDYTLAIILLGTMALGLVAGCVGTFAVLRRESLLGDAVAHAALPGVALGFLLAGKVPLVLLIGAMLAGWLVMLLVQWLTRAARVSLDSALAMGLTSFFGFGLVLMSATKTNSGVERFLFGQAATLLPGDVWTIAIVGGLVLAALAIWWREWKLITFDPLYAQALGKPTKFLNAMLTGMIVTAVAIGLESVGVVLMSALIVAPGLAARAWTNRLGVMVVLAGLFGMLACALGTLGSHHLSDAASRRTIPTGPAIVLCATAITIGSIAINKSRQRVNLKQQIG